MAQREGDDIVKGRPLGFRSKNPNALTNLERQQRWRRKNGDRCVGSFCLHIDACAAMLYIKKQWGFESSQEAIEVSMRHLALMTRQGLKRIQLDAVDADPLE